MNNDMNNDYYERLKQQSDERLKRLHRQQEWQHFALVVGKIGGRERRRRERNPKNDMTWATMAADERTKLKIGDSDAIRFKCACGCGKFAVVVSPVPAFDAFPKSIWQLVCLNCKQRHV